MSASNLKKRKSAPKPGATTASSSVSSPTPSPTSSTPTSSTPSISTPTSASSVQAHVPQKNVQNKVASTTNENEQTAATPTTSQSRKKKRPKQHQGATSTTTISKQAEGQSKVASEGNKVESSPAAVIPPVGQKGGKGTKKKQTKDKALEKAETEENGESGEGPKTEKIKGEKHPCCFLDISIDGVNAGRIVIELFRDILPKTCENFRALCTGEKSTETKKLHYKDSVIHRITPGFVFQGGDFDHGDGSGGQSIYGAPFEDEGFFHRHVKPGLVAMANKGKDGNTSQFYITLSKQPLKYLDSKHVIFGKVIVGMAVVRSIERVGTEEGVPKAKVVITDCGRFKLKTERKKMAGLPEVPAPAKPTCPKCGGGLKYVKRLPEKKLVRFWCKNKECEGAVYLPDTHPTTERKEPSSSE